MGPICVIKNGNPLFAQYRFEWHPRTGKVYVIDHSRGRHDQATGQMRCEAEVLAEHCDTKGRAFGFVQTWCRGYQAGQHSKASVIVGKSG